MRGCAAVTGWSASARSRGSRAAPLPRPTTGGRRPARRIEQETELPEVSGTGPIAFASFVFDPGNTAQQSIVIVPRIVVGRRNGQSWLTVLGATGDLPAARHAGPVAASVCADGGRRGRAPRSAAASGRASSRRRSAGSAAGELDKVVLARGVEARLRDAARPELAGDGPGRDLPDLLDLPRRRPGRRLAGDADPPRGRPGHLPGAGRHDPAQRRRGARPQARPRPGPLGQEPDRARTGRRVGGAGRWRRSAPA